MKLILIRHGETIENQKGIMQGHLDGVLSETGIQQAKKLAFKLKDEKIDCIYSSDLARAADTAKEISKYYEKIPIYFVKEMREIDLGSWTGKNIKNITQNKLPEDIENKKDLQKRVKKFLNKLYNKHLDSTVLVVGHNWINKSLISVILNESFQYLNRIDYQPNASLSIFEIWKNKKPIVYLINSIKHLE